MIFIVSLISTLFVLLILILLLEYRSRNRRALARRMRYYAGDMDTQEKPKERKPLAERFMDLLHSAGKHLSNIRHARGLDLKMQNPVSVKRICIGSRCIHCDKKAVCRFFGSYCGGGGGMGVCLIED